MLLDGIYYGKIPISMVYKSNIIIWRHGIDKYFDIGRLLLHSNGKAYISQEVRKLIYADLSFDLEEKAQIEIEEAKRGRINSFISIDGKHNLIDCPTLKGFENNNYLYLNIQGNSSLTKSNIILKDLNLKIQVEGRNSPAKNIEILYNFNFYQEPKIQLSRSERIEADQLIKPLFTPKARHSAAKHGYATLKIKEEGVCINLRTTTSRIFVVTKELSNFGFFPRGRVSNTKKINQNTTIPFAFLGKTKILPSEHIYMENFSIFNNFQKIKKDKAINFNIKQNGYFVFLGEGRISFVKNGNIFSINKINLNSVNHVSKTKKNIIRKEIYFKQNSFANISKSQIFNLDSFSFTESFVDMSHSITKIVKMQTEIQDGYKTRLIKDAVAEIKLNDIILNYNNFILNLSEPESFKVKQGINQDLNNELKISSSVRSDLKDLIITDSLIKPFISIALFSNMMTLIYSFNKIQLFEILSNNLKLEQKNSFIFIPNFVSIESNNLQYNKNLFCSLFGQLIERKTSLEEIKLINNLKNLSFLFSSKGEKAIISFEVAEKAQSILSQTSFNNNSSFLLNFYQQNQGTIKQTRIYEKERIFQQASFTDRAFLSFADAWQKPQYNKNNNSLYIVQVFDFSFSEDTNTLVLI